ncbi:MAG: uroporphyrinogen-III C-methyltransferase [Burkholderiales bacterium]
MSQSPESSPPPTDPVAAQAAPVGSRPEPAPGGAAAPAPALSRGLDSLRVALAQARARPQWIALGLAVLALLLVLVQWQRTGSIAQEAARRLQGADARAAQLDTQLRLTQDQARDLQARAAVLEGKLTEALGRQAQLESLYRSISHDSLDSVLSEVENALAIASQQLVVSGNVQGALVALSDADGRLARIRQPQAIGLRRLLQRDIDRLKALPAVDLVGLALRLDTVTAVVDQLPLMASAATPAARVAEPAPAQAERRFSLEGLASTGRRGLDALLAELSQLFRVNRADTPDTLLLAPDQQYFLRQNLRLLLLSARVSLLSRLEPVYRSDLDRAVAWLGAHYDRDQRSVANAIAALRQLQSARIAPDIPSLGDTLAAVRAARTALETNP